jgi:hypothetical protein
VKSVVLAALEDSKRKRTVERQRWNKTHQSDVQMGRTGFAWLLACLALRVAAPARKHNPGHYLRLFDIPEVCPHLSFVMPWTLEQEAKEVVLFQIGSLSIREQYSL